jgi:hypothetical protein
LCGCPQSEIVYTEGILLNKVKYYEEEELCPNCVAHPDFSLLVLKYLDDNADWHTSPSAFIKIKDSHE